MNYITGGGGEILTVHPMVRLSVLDSITRILLGVPISDSATNNLMKKLHASILKPFDK